MKGRNDDDITGSKESEKIYTTRFGGNQVQALSNVNFWWRRKNMWRSWESPDPERQHF